MARRASAFPLSMRAGGHLHLLQHFVGPFLHHLHLRSIPRGATGFFKEALNQLQQDLDAYSGAPESQKQEETRTAERLVQALYMHHILLCNSEAACYVKILQKLWEFEDQGLISQSSLINDLAMRALLEAHHIKICRSAVVSAFHSMFITSSQGNKGVLVDAIICAISMQSDLLHLWDEAIICGIGKSIMRLNVVEIALLDRCTSDDAIINQKAGPLLYCIKAAFSCLYLHCTLLASVGLQWLASHIKERECVLVQSCNSCTLHHILYVCLLRSARFMCLPWLIKSSLILCLDWSWKRSFNCDKIRQAVCEKISYSRGQASLYYISFFQALGEIDKVDSMVYINLLIKFLGEKKGLDMAIQTALYNAIDCLKRRSSENVYKVPYLQVFSERWLL